MENNQNVFVRPLNENDTDSVRLLDECSGNYVQQWVEDNTDYAWGAFLGNTLIGYATIGYADDCRGVIESYPGRTCDSLLLSDVYIKPEYRGRGYAKELISEVIAQRIDAADELVFLMLQHESLAMFYEKFGFREIGDSCMVRPIS